MAAARDALARDAAALSGGVGAQALARLLAAATLERYKPGDVIIERGSRPATLFNIARGKVSVEVNACPAPRALLPAPGGLRLWYHTEREQNRHAARQGSGGA